MNQTVDVELTVNGTEDVLIFKLDEDHPYDYTIELNNESNQLQIKKVFSKLLEMLIESDIDLNLVIADGYSKGLYKDVCSEYIVALNQEITEVKENIKRQLKSR